MRINELNGVLECVLNFKSGRFIIDPFQNNPATSHMFMGGVGKW